MAKEILSRGDCVGHATRITVPAINIQPGRDQLREHRVGHISAGRLLHHRNGLILGVGPATDRDCLHAPGFGMIHPVTLSAHLTITRLSLSSLADSILTNVIDRAEVAVVAGGAVRLGWIRTHTGTRIARASVVTLIARCARFRSAGTCSIRTNVIGRTGVAVITCRAIWFTRVRTHTGAWIARASVVALIARCAGHRVRANASS